ncbi:MAG: DUF2075 domain-containing protein [Coxiellaceae bacterium]|nr:DUF2075 domain-containing protein [Coxiellaceae bacterium]
MPKINPVIIIPENIADEISSYNDDNPRKKAFDKFLEQLKSSQLSNGANLEQLMGKQVLSVRLEGKARLLITPHKVKGKFAWVLLETLWEHEYDKARFLKKGILSTYLQKHKEKIDALILETTEGEDVVLTDTTDVDTAVDDEAIDVELIEACIYNKCVISPTTTQNECLIELTKKLKGEQLGALVAGAPGTGKTLLAYQLIEKLIEDDPAAKICYVADSAHLRKMLQTQWQQSPTYDESLKDAVEFYDYIALMYATNPDRTSELEAVDDEDLKSFFEDKQKKLKRRAATTRITSINFEQFRQECDVMASLETLELYHAMGSSHTLFPGEDNAALREQLWETYQAYNTKLTASHQYHPKLKLIESPPDNPFARHIIIVDEACDLSRVELRNLIQLGVKIIFLGDNNQDLTHTSHTIEFLSQEIADSFPNPHHYITSLDASFRCSINITEVASTLLTLKRKVTAHGSALVNTELKSAIDSTGNVEHISNRNSDRFAALTSSANTAIICHAKDQDMIRKKLGTDLVFTVEEIKGLGFQTVILWELISTKQAIRLNELFDKGKVQRDDISADDKQLITALNNIYTALTRAEIQIILMQSGSHPAITALINRMTQDGKLTHAIDETSNTPSTIEEWLDMADKLYREIGLNDQSNDIYERQTKNIIAIDGIEQANDIYRRQVNILNEIGQEEAATAIEEAYGVAEEIIDYTDAEAKLTPPSSPKPQLIGDPEEKSTAPPIEPLCIKAGAIEEAEDTGRKARATAIEARIENYQLQFTTGTSTGRNKRSGKKRGTKKKPSKTNVTFNRQLGQTQIDAIISCKIDEEIRNITAQHLAALLCATQDPTIPNGKFDELILKVLTINPSISDSLAREIQTLLHKVDINVTVLLNMLKTKQPFFYIHGISAIAELAKTNDIVSLWLGVTLKTKDAGPIAQLPDILQDHKSFARWIAPAETNPAILNAILQGLDQDICINIINTEPSNFVKLIEIAEHHHGFTRILLKQTSKLHSAFFHALTDPVCALPTIELLKQNKDDIPDNILVTLFTAGPDRKLNIDKCCPATLEGLNELAIIKPSICTSLINFPRERGATFERLLLAVTTYSKQGSPLLIAMAKHNKEVLEAMIPALSFKDERDLTPLHQLAIFHPKLFMTAIRLAETCTEDPELSRMLTTWTKNEEYLITPLASLLHSSKPTMREFIALAEEKPALYKALIHTFKLNSANDLIYTATINTKDKDNDFSCLIDFFNFANSHDDFRSHLTTQFINAFNVVQRKKDRTDSLCRIINNFFELFLPFLEFSTKDKEMQKIFNDVLITLYDDNKSTLLHVSANKEDPQYFTSLFEQAKHFPTLYITMLEGMILKVFDNRTPLFMLVQFQPALFYDFIDYTLTHRSVDEQSILMKAMLIMADKDWTVLQQCIYQGQTKLFELAEKQPILMQFITDSLPHQDRNCYWTNIHMIAYYLPNYIEKLVEFCDESPKGPDRLLDALPISTQKIKGKPAVESGLQMIAERAGKLPLTCIINFIIKNIRSTDGERREKSIKLLANFIQGTYNNGNTGLHYILYANLRRELYNTVVEIATTEPTLQLALDAAIDVKNTAGTSPKQLMQAYTDHCRLFQLKVLPELIHVIAEGKEATPQKTDPIASSRAT